MNKLEAAQKLKENANLGFLGTLTPAMICFWKIDRKGQLNVLKNALALNLLNQKKHTLKKGVMAGRATVYNGELMPKGGFIDQVEKMPSHEQFQKLINDGEIKIFEVQL